MITKDEFLIKSDVMEVFCLVDEFVTRVNDKLPKENKIIITDRMKGSVISEMVNNPLIEVF